MSQTENEFANLMKRVQEGSKEAAQELHATYGEHVLRVVRQKLNRKLRTKFDSIDFVQDVWASFFHDIPASSNFKTPDDLIAFLCAMARNKVVDAVRMRTRTQKYNVDREISLASVPDEGTSLLGPLNTPSAQLMGNEEWEQFLQKQPLVHRRVFVLLRAGNTVPQIAQELDITERSVFRIVSRNISEAAHE
jgi:RNA polymerase sigma-70 factor (ECF subfamily)